jgi:hypothetical protein
MVQLWMKNREKIKNQLVIKKKNINLLVESTEAVAVQNINILMIILGDRRKPINHQSIQKNKSKIINDHVRLICIYILI